METTATLTTGLNTTNATMKDIMDKLSVKFFAKLVKQFINETIHSTPDITVHIFVNSQIELFAIWLFKKLQIEKYIRFNSMGIAPDAIKDIAIWTVITKLQLVGKYASLYTNNSKTITMMEILEADTVLAFMKYCEGVKELTGDIYNCMISNPEMLCDAVKDLTMGVFEELGNEACNKMYKEVGAALAAANGLENTET